MNKTIYADNAATTQLDNNVFDAMKLYLLEEYGNASQPYSLGRTAKLALKKSREEIAECIGSCPDELYFTSCGTESNNWVIKSFSNIENKTLIVTSCIEHHAILNACESISSKTKIIKVPVNKYGEVSCDELNNILRQESIILRDKGSILVSIMTANNEIGTIQPIKDLANIAHTHGAYFHTDAVQAVGHVNLNVKEMNIDYLSASAHKFNGPKGIGFLYAKKGSPLTGFLDGGAQENGKRAGTENVASIVGMAVALKNNVSELNQNNKRITELENQLIEILNNSTLDFIRNGSCNHIPGSINLSFKNTDGEMLLHRLDLRGISISTGSACDSVNTKISHVIESIGVNEKYSKGTIRISLGKKNTIDDVKTIAKEIINILG